MGAKTTQKGEVGEAMVIADLIRQGHDIAIPFGHNQPFDLIVVRKEDGRLEKVQVKYATSDGKTVRAVIGSSSAWVSHRYTADEVDWVVIYEATTNQCFYLPSSLWDGQTPLSLRLVPTLNAQVKGIWWAENFTRLLGDPRQLSPPSSAQKQDLLFDRQPE
jgi:hypothetical protein